MYAANVLPRIIGRTVVVMCGGHTATHIYWPHWPRAADVVTKETTGRSVPGRRRDVRGD